jgi:SAM-dependent methyltransferase
MEPNTGRPLQNFTWTSGDSLDQYIGRWSYLAARQFIAWLSLPGDLRWLDIGCGAGAVSLAVLQDANPGMVLGVDRSLGFIHFARQKMQDPRIRFLTGDAQAVPLRGQAFDAVVSGLVLNFIPQPEQAVREMARVVKPGGVVALYVWDYAGKMQMLRHFWNAAWALDPSSYPMDEGRRFPICDPQALADLFRGAGLREVRVIPLDIDTHFTDFDDYWNPFLGSQGPAPGYVMSLSDERRAALRERLREALPIALDGSIPLVARAWAVSGYSVGGVR